MAQAPEFKYAPMFQVGEDTTEYYHLTSEHVSLGNFEGKEILKVTPEALTMLIERAFTDVNFMLRRSHNECVAKILKDPEASDNDKYVALTSFATPKSLPKAFCRFVRIPVQPLFMVKRARESGPTSLMKKLSAAVYTTLTPRTLSVILRTLP